MKMTLFRKGLVVMMCFIFFIVGACDHAKMRKVYSDPSNFVTVTGKVANIHFNDDSTALYFKIENLPSGFSDDYFKIVGKNLDIVNDKSIDSKIHEGDEIEFITSPWYLGNGYIMPIVGLTTADGEELLSFEEGQKNLLKSIGWW